MVSFADLKKNRNSSLAELAKELNAINTKNTYQDESDKYWTLTVDKKTETGQAIIRFLPPPGEESKPFIRYWEHGFQGPSKGEQKGMWYIEKSLTTLNLPDPCSEYNTALWETGIEANQKLVRDRKRKLYYVSNIYVVKDFANPENNGKVFLFKYGKRIFDMINEAMKPTFEGVAPMNPFDLWDGANFNLRAAKADGQRNYFKSTFSDAGPLLDDDDAMQKIWEKCHSLQEVIAPTKFKTYEELKSRLDKVLRLDTKQVPMSNKSDDDEGTSSKAKLRKPVSSAHWLDDDDDTPQQSDDDDENFFKKLRSNDED